MLKSSELSHALSCSWRRSRVVGGTAWGWGRQAPCCRACPPGRLCLQQHGGYPVFAAGSCLVAGSWVPLPALPRAATWFFWSPLMSQLVCRDSPHNQSYHDLFQQAGGERECMCPCHRRMSLPRESVQLANHDNSAGRRPHGTLPPQFSACGLGVQGSSQEAVCKQPETSPGVTSCLYFEVAEDHHTCRPLLAAAAARACGGGQRPSSPPTADGRSKAICRRAAEHRAVVVM